MTPKPPTPPRRKKGEVPSAPSVAPPLEPPYYQMAVTPLGRSLLTQPVAPGGLRPELVRRIVEQSLDLATLLHALDRTGPLLRPVRSLLPGAPTRGAAYNRAIEVGIEEFWANNVGRHHPPFTAPNGKPIPVGKLVDASATTLLQQHPVGALRQLDKVLAIAGLLGLIWISTQPVNEVIGAIIVGSAAYADNGSFEPNIPSWDAIKSRFLETLFAAHQSCANGSGYAPIGSLRGALGLTLHISAPVADELIRQARETGDRGEQPILLHFEPDEEVSYASERRPLIWKQHAFDYVEVVRRFGGSEHDQYAETIARTFGR